MVLILVAPAGVLTWPNSAVSWAVLEDPRNLHSKFCISLLLQAMARSPPGKLKLPHRGCADLTPPVGAGFQDGGSQSYQSSHGLDSKPQNSLSLNFIVQSKSQRQCDSTLPLHVWWHVCRKREVYTAPPLDTVYQGPSWFVFRLEPSRDLLQPQGHRPHPKPINSQWGLGVYTAICFFVSC